MNESKLINLVHKLAHKTDAGSIEWEDALETGSYSASFPPYSILIALDRARQSYRLDLLDEQANLLESVSVEKGDSESPERSKYSAIETLYRAVRRWHDQKVNTAIDTILQQLN